MSEFELISIVLSSIAVFVSLYVWSGQRRLQRESIELQRITAALDKRQLQLLNEHEKDKRVAKLSLVFERRARAEYLIIQNIGASDALAVDVRPVEPPAAESFVVESEFSDKLPIKRLRPRESLSLISATTMDTPPKHTFHVSWKNADGSTAMEEFVITP